MQFPRYHETPANGLVAEIPVWPMPAMSDKEAIVVGVEKPAGVPDVAFTAILDADVQRRRAQRIGRPWPETSYKAVLRRLAQIREPLPEYDADPLLWMLRVWRDVEQATLPFSPVQRAGQHSARHPGIPEIVAGGTRHRAMAARACTYGDRWSVIYPICRQLYDEVRGRCVFETLPRSDYQTGHRILWYATASGRDRAEAWSLAFHASLFPDWRQKIPSRPLSKERFAELVPSIRYRDRWSEPA